MKFGKSSLNNFTILLGLFIHTTFKILGYIFMHYLLAFFEDLHIYIKHFSQYF